jgi:hypothetical protein
VRSAERAGMGLVVEFFGGCVIDGIAHMGLGTWVVIDGVAHVILYSVVGMFEMFRLLATLDPTLEFRNQFKSNHLLG